MQRKRRSDAGKKREGTPSVPDVHVTFRINPERDEQVWLLYQNYIDQGYKPRDIFLWALLNASGVPTEGMKAPNNGLPKAALEWLRDELTGFLQEHKLVVSAPSDERGSTISKDDKKYLKALLGGFSDLGDDED